MDDNKNISEENSNILELIDENGNTVPFEHLDTVQIDKNDYIVCIPYNEEDEDVTEIVLFKIDKTAQSEDCLAQVTDEALAEKIYKEFKQRNNDKFDFDE